MLNAPKISEQELEGLIDIVDQVNRFLRLGCWGDLAVSSHHLSRKATKLNERLWNEQNKNSLKKTRV